MDNNEDEDADSEDDGVPTDPIIADSNQTKHVQFSGATEAQDVESDEKDNSEGE